MSPLVPADFDRYFAALYGAECFPWQRRLLERVAGEGAWPALLDLPTGTGKTAAIDIALFHLALDAGAPAQERRASRRIVLVVDRRTVVDQAFERACHIRDALERARDGVLLSVAERLRSLSDSGTTLDVALLRGGIPRDDAWARRPDQPLVAVSTVDQIGSRLLFRGYGVSAGMRPIHAGLLGSDTLILLDEVHLSLPFKQTLSRLACLAGESSLPRRWCVVEMSATPGSDADGRRFGLNDDDRAHPVLARRLAAKKPFERPPPVKTSGDEDARRKTFAAECARQAGALAGAGRVVGVIVNRVATARHVARDLRERAPSADVRLVTGRMRPLDRNDANTALRERARTGRSRDPHGKPLIVVATQCIEAGADYDFDALVTECASLDALRQRFGRLNRIGDTADARGCVLIRADAVAAATPDPVYGESIAEVWDWLGKAPADFGIDALDPALPRGETLHKLLAPSTRAPVLLPAHLDAWVQTAPAPTPDPDVSLWLHGVDRSPQIDVNVVWRVEVTDELLAIASIDDRALDALGARLEACPPVSLEALPVPLFAARAWLEQGTEEELSDVEGMAGPEEERRGKTGGRLALRWGGEAVDVVRGRDLRPGDTIIVPVERGGLADGTWDPSNTSRVADLAHRARFEQTGRLTLRLREDALPPGLLVPNLDLDDVDERTILEEWVDAAQIAQDEWLAQGARTLVGRRPAAIVRVPEVAQDGEIQAPGYVVLVGRKRVGVATADDALEEDHASLTGVEVLLEDHLAGVGDWARRFARACGLPESLVQDLELAGRLHDLGKRDPRFQRMLHGGDAFRAEIGRDRPLAKSRLVAADRSARERARRTAGYPKGARHELASVALIAAHEHLVAQATDRDLVLHLVASHHGWCRPFAPVAVDREPVPIELDGLSVSSAHGLERLDSGIADRFWRIVERYGWHGSAWLEAILRLADHRRSAEEQEAER